MYNPMELMLIEADTQRVQDEDILTKAYDLIGNVHPAVFMSILGTLVDKYESDHKGFNSVEALKNLLEISEMLHTDGITL